MSFSDDSSDSEWKESKLKASKIIKAEKTDKKYYRQRFVERWLDRFKPWLSRDEKDPNQPFCLPCRCRLNCNKCHLQRHERTTKHYSNLQSYLTAKGLQPMAPNQNLGQRKERKKLVKIKTDKECEDSKFESVFMDIAYAEEENIEANSHDTSHEAPKDYQFVQEDPEIDNVSTPHLYDDLNPVVAVEIKRNVKNKQMNTAGTVDKKKDRQKLLLQIQKDKNELMSSFNELFSTASVEKKERNHVELFFESVSSSVNALSPKLIAEAKMRVSQLICELELRGITESEANTSATSSTVLLSAPLGNTYILNHGPEGRSNGINQVGSSQHDPTYDTAN